MNNSQQKQNMQQNFEDFKKINIESSLTGLELLDLFNESMLMDQTHSIQHALKHVANEAARRAVLEWQAMTEKDEAKNKWKELNKAALDVVIKGNLIEAGKISAYVLEKNTYCDASEELEYTMPRYLVKKTVPSTTKKGKKHE